MKIPIKQFRGLLTILDEADQSPEYMRHSENVAFRNGACYPEKIVEPTDSIADEYMGEKYEIYYSNDITLLGNPSVDNYSETKYLSIKIVLASANKRTLIFIDNKYFNSIPSTKVSVTYNDHRIIFLSDSAVHTIYQGADGSFKLKNLGEYYSTKMPTGFFKFEKNWKPTVDAAGKTYQDSFNDLWKRYIVDQMPHPDFEGFKAALSALAAKFNESITVNLFGSTDYIVTGSDGENEYVLFSGLIGTEYQGIFIFDEDARKVINKYMSDNSFERISFFVKPRIIDPDYPNDTTKVIPGKGDFRLLAMFDLNKKSSQYVLIENFKVPYDKVAMTGTFLAQILGYVYDAINPITPIISFSLYCEAGGISFAVKNNVLYRCSIGAGNIQKLNFHLQNTIKLPLNGIIITISNINGNLGVFTTKGLFILGMQDSGGDVVLFPKDITTLIIQDKYDVAEFPDGIIVNTTSGVYVLNGSEKKNLSEPINNIAIKNFPISSVAVDIYKNYIYLIIYGYGIYRYSSIYSVWEFFPISVTDFWDAGGTPYIVVDKKYGVLDFFNKSVVGKIYLPRMNFGDTKSYKILQSIFIEGWNNTERIGKDRIVKKEYRNGFHYLNISIQIKNILSSLEISINPLADVQFKGEIVEHKINVADYDEEPK